jgi:Trk K+ transport system NAD-binding subunit
MGEGTAVVAADLPVLVVGIGHVGVAVVHRLRALDVPVRALLTPTEQVRHAGEFRALGVDIASATPAWENELAAEDFSRICSVILAADNDSSNVDACLLIRRYSAEVPVIVRVSDQTLVRFLRMSVPHVEPYSMGSVAAPVAAETALHLLAQPRHTAPADRAPPAHGVLRTAVAWLLGLSLAAQLVVAVVVASALGLHGLPAIGALLAAGMGAAVGSVKWTAAAGWPLVALGLLDRVALVAAVALVADTLMATRYRQFLPVAPVRLRDHVVILGAGNVGARAAELLHQRRVRVVVIERDGNDRNVQRLRSLGIDVVVGDATVDDTLELAGAWRAGALLALTSSDAVNLHVGLQLSDPKVGVPTMVRLLSPELCDHAARAANLNPLSTVAATASSVCRTVERLRGERQKLRDDSVARPTGRYAGPEFDVGRTTDQHARPGRTPSSPGLDAEPVAGGGADGGV